METRRIVLVVAVLVSMVFFSCTASQTSVKSQGVCRLDKVATFAEVGGGGPQRIEVGGHGGQHLDFYPDRGIKAVSYIIPPLTPGGIPAVWFGFGSLWEGDTPECANFDWIADATDYATGRLNMGHSGLVVDLRGSTPKVVANVANLPQVEVDALLARHGQGRQVVAPATPVVSVGSCPQGQRSDHPPVVDQPWSPGPSDSWRIVNFWSNQPGVNQNNERKLLLEPGQAPKLLGGGSVWSWPTQCESVVRGEFAKNHLSEITLEQLEAEGLVQ